MADSPENAARRCLRWWHLLLIFVALVIAAFLLWRVAVSRAVEAELQAIRDAGYPATAAELDAWYERVPDEENAALVLKDAFARIKAETVNRLPALSRPSEWPAPAEPLSIPMDASIDYHVEINAEALELLHEGAAMEHSRYPVDLTQGIEMFHPDLGPLRTGMRLLALEAVHHAERGRGDHAAGSVRAILGVAGSLRQEPILISQLVRLAGQSLSASTLERVLNRSEPSDESMSQLLRELTEAEQPTATVQGFIGERATTNDIFIGRSLYPDEEVGGVRRALAISGVLQMDHLVCLDITRDFMETARMPTHQRMDAAARTEDRLNDLPVYALLTGIVMPSLSKAFAVELRTLAQLRTARAALAVERYRLAHGALPQKLDDVAPDFIDAVPDDPFTGEPLKYRAPSGGGGEGGFIVYSVGEDKTDDGGAKTNAAGEQFEPGSDIPFRVSR